MPNPTRVPTIVTVDTGAFTLAPCAQLAATCEHEEHQPLLIVPTDTDLLQVAGTAEELRIFAYDLIEAVNNYHLAEMESTA
jgi:hypothetical protein